MASSDAGRGGSFGIDKKRLSQIMQGRSAEDLAMFKADGGVEELCKKLNTSPDHGLQETVINESRDVFGSNMMPLKRCPKNFIGFVWDAILDIYLIILFVAAIISLGLSFNKPEKNLREEDLYQESEETADWIDGSAILVAVIVIVLVTAFSDWLKEYQFHSFYSHIECEDKFATIRKGQMEKTPIRDIVVGDICLVKYGDLLPADGIVIQSEDLQVDESALTGKTGHVKKEKDDLMMSGTPIMKGSGKMVVTAVGPNSQTRIIYPHLNETSKDKKEKTGKKKKKEEGGDGDRAPEVQQPFIPPDGNNRANMGADPDQIEMDVQGSSSNSQSASNANGADGPNNEPADNEENEKEEPEVKTGSFHKEKAFLQTELIRLAIRIAYAGIIVAIITVIINVSRYSIEDGTEILKMLVKYFIFGVAVVVVAIPQGLTLAVTLVLAYSVKKMLHDNNLVRHLDAVETMGTASAICCDRTGTLTINRMTVAESYIGETTNTAVPDFSTLNKKTGELILQSISINSDYASEIEPSKVKGRPWTHLGNKTECALLEFMHDMGRDYSLLRRQYPKDSRKHDYAFSSNRKWRGTVIKLRDEENIYRVLCKGACEVVVNKCDFILDQSGKPQKFLREKQNALLRDTIENMANKGLRPICLAYKDYVEGLHATNKGSLEGIDWEKEGTTLAGLTCICILGIKDPVRQDVKQAIHKCQRAGITVRMVTGDNVNTARSVALECGILDPKETVEGQVLEGEELNQSIRNSTVESCSAGEPVISQQLIDEVLPKLRVLARSTSLYKNILVKGIVDSGQIVAVTDENTNDGSALKKADIGLALGISGTDVAKEASDIILTDNFTSILKAIVWGRNVHYRIAKLIEFQLTPIIVTVLVAFLGACSINDSPLKAIQLLWVNLIIDTLASLALATESPSKELLRRKESYGRTQLLISHTMAKNIFFHALYQLIVIVILLFAGPDLLKIDSGIQNEDKVHDPPTQHFTMIFNTFVLMTLFNELNALKTYKRHNIIRRIRYNPIFPCIWIGTIIAQFLIIHFGGSAFHTTSLDLSQWALCVCLGIGTMLLDLFVFFIPDRCFPSFKWCQRCNKENVENPKDGDRLEDDPVCRWGQILWVRGLRRLLQQRGLINAFNSVTSLHSLRSMQNVTTGRWPQFQSSTKTAESCQAEMAWETTNV